MMRSKRGEVYKKERGEKTVQQNEKAGKAEEINITREFEEKKIWSVKRTQRRMSRGRQPDSLAEKKIQGKSYI